MRSYLCISCKLRNSYQISRTKTGLVVTKVEITRWICKDGYFYHAAGSDAKQPRLEHCTGHDRCCLQCIQPLKCVISSIVIASIALDILLIDIFVFEYAG